MANEVFREPFPDWITFASSSAVDNLASLVSREVLRRSKIASIGPVTSKTIRRHGLTVDAEAAVYTMAGLVAAIEDCPA
jgi:uroporphyrinogen III methyltransferase/synthase